MALYSLIVLIKKLLDTLDPLTIVVLVSPCPVSEWREAGVSGVRRHIQDPQERGKTEFTSGWFSLHNLFNPVSNTTHVYWFPLITAPNDLSKHLLTTKSNKFYRHDVAIHLSSLGEVGVGSNIRQKIIIKWKLLAPTDVVFHCLVYMKPTHHRAGLTNSIQSLVYLTHVQFQASLECYNLPRYGVSCYNHRGKL